MLIFKVLLPEEWRSFETTGAFPGSPLDATSGFIHCSSRSQVAATIGRFFADDAELVVVGVDTTRLGASCRWERATSGELFPHVYRALTVSDVVEVHQVASPADLDQILRGS